MLTQLHKVPTDSYLLLTCSLEEGTAGYLALADGRIRYCMYCTPSARGVWLAYAGRRAGGQSSISCGAQGWNSRVQLGLAREAG